MDSLKPVPDHLTIRNSRRLLLGVFLAGLLLLGWQVLSPFVIPVAWAGILVYVTWPLYAWLRARLGGRHTPSALVMTVLLAFILILPILWVVFLLQSEISGVYHQLAQQLARGKLSVPEVILDIPWLGNWLAEQGVRDAPVLLSAAGGAPLAAPEFAPRNWFSWLAGFRKVLVERIQESRVSDTRLGLKAKAAGPRHCV